MDTFPEPKRHPSGSAFERKHKGNKGFEHFWSVQKASIWGPKRGTVVGPIGLILLSSSTRNRTEDKEIGRGQRAGATRNRRFSLKTRSSNPRVHFDKKSAILFCPRGQKDRFICSVLQCVLMLFGLALGQILRNHRNPEDPG